MLLRLILVLLRWILMLLVTCNIMRRVMPKHENIISISLKINTKSIPTTILTLRADPELVVRRCVRRQLQE